MKDIVNGISNAFNEGLKAADSPTASPAKLVKRRSKLEEESQMILQYWSAGRSLRFISHRLSSKGLNCKHTTVLRFIKNNLSL